MIKFIRNMGRLNGFLEYNFCIIQTIGVPIKPMLAELYNDSKQLVETLLSNNQNGYCEYKYDGERIQVHYNNNQNENNNQVSDIYLNEIQLFNRALDDRTWKYPILVQRLNEYFRKNTIKSAIFDCEMICYDDNGRILAFQEMQSQKKITEDIKLICFDILQLNGTLLIQDTLSVRQKIYKNIIPNDGSNQIIQFIESTPVNSQDIFKIENMYQNALSQGLEGIMVKKDSEYKPGKRTDWGKLKSYKDIDLILVGGFWGKGKRQSYLGAYLLASINQSDGKICPITKIGTGFSDIFLQQNTVRLLQNTQKEISDHIVKQKAIKPDVWFEPQEIWEIRYESITFSPKYYLPKNSSNFIGGLSLRFPRFIRKREDKKLNDATTTDQLINFYNQQNKRFRIL